MTPEVVLHATKRGTLASLPPDAPFAGTAFSLTPVALKEQGKCSPQKKKAGLRNKSKEERITLLSQEE